MTPPTIETLLLTARSQLSPVHDSARLDSELLLAHVLNKPRSWLYTWPEHQPTPLESEQFQQLIERRQKGTPVAYLTGQCGFWSLTLKVNTATLIPRPETELLVEQALERIPCDAPLKIVDLGTGSGAIALSVARERPECQVMATDRCPNALATARHNAERTGITNISFRSGDWYQPLAGERFDIILSNPPYIASDDPHLQQGDLRFEPSAALAAGRDGLDAIRSLIKGGRNHLNPAGWLIVEHGFDQGAAVARLLQQSGYHPVQGYRDLAGRDRITAAQAL